jgi:hypothetical protein
MATRFFTAALFGARFLDIPYAGNYTYTYNAITSYRRRKKCSTP